MEGDDINADDLSNFIDEQIKKESTLDLSKFVPEELKKDDEIEAINTAPKKKVRRPPTKKTNKTNLSDLDLKFE